MTQFAEERERLTAFGFNEDEIDALELLWANDAVGPFLTPVAETLRITCWPVAYGYDAAFHGLNPDDAEFYFGHAFTGHQAAVITTHPHAMNNLWTDDRTEDEFDALLNDEVPRDVTTNILLAAQQPEEADAYVVRYLVADTQQAAEVIAKEVAMLAAFRLTPPDCCQ